MANTFPTTVTPGALSTFLDKLKSVGVPDKIDRTYLKQIGFSSSNHAAFVPVMKFVGLLDSSGKPTDRYRQGLRGGEKGKALVAEGIRLGYKTLFDTYPDANARPTTDITQFFKTHTDAGETALQRTVSTFQTLCTFGNFGAPSTPPVAPEDVDTDVEDDESSTKNNRQRQRQPSGGAVTINVNIALSVDATSDPAVYDEFSPRWPNI